MVFFTEVVLLAAKAYKRTLSEREKTKSYYRQKTVLNRKTKVPKTLTEDEKKRLLARKALNNWLSRLKNQYRPHKFKKNVKVEIAETFSDENNENGEDSESSSDEEEGADATEEGAYASEEGADASEEGADATEEGADATEEGADASEEAADASEEAADASEEGAELEEGDASEEGYALEEDAIDANEIQEECEN
jgi:hypothetical protein